VETVLIDDLFRGGQHTRPRHPVTGEPVQPWHVHLVVVDVEGWEMAVAAGMPRLLQVGKPPYVRLTLRPRVAIDATRCNPTAFVQYMYSIGYVFIDGFNRPSTLFSATQRLHELLQSGKGEGMPGWFVHRGARGSWDLRQVQGLEAYPLLRPPPPRNAMEEPTGRGPMPGGEWPGNWLLKSPHVFTRCTVPGTVALTFDDGPYIFTNQLLELFEAHGAKATLFVSGWKQSCIYDHAAVLRRAVDGGHQIGSHTWSHAPLLMASDEMVEDQMVNLETALMRIIGRSPAYMRPPYGGHNERSVAMLAKLHYKIILWDVDPLDWQRQLDQSTRAYEESSADPTVSHIVLNHDVHDTTVLELMPWVLDWVKRRGYRAVTVGECLGESDPRSWYKEILEPMPPYPSPDTSWYCV
jgi:peptidoglycan/xylan/chitin deacetylase (PgdA/CDA1 family)